MPLVSDIKLPVQLVFETQGGTGVAPEESNQGNAYLHISPLHSGVARRIKVRQGKGAATDAVDEIHHNTLQ